MDNEEDRIVDGFLNLPDQLWVAFRTPERCIPFTLIPHYSRLFTHPLWRGMVLIKGKLMSMYKARSLYMDQGSLKSPPMRQHLQDIYMIRSDGVRSTTTLLDIVLTWTPEQMAQIGTVREEPTEGTYDGSVQAAVDAVEKNYARCELE